jgi:hypothetical protein
MGLDEQLERQMVAHLADNATFLARMNAHLQATIPLYIEESNISPTLAAGSSATLVIPPSRDTIFKLTGIYVSVPLNTTSATLQLGSFFTLPLQNTTTLLCPVQKILHSTDLRQLTFVTGSANGGSAFVWLWGEAIPSYGKL